MNRYIGIDLGGTKIAAVAYDATQQTTTHEATIGTNRQDGADGVIRQVIELVRATANNAGWALADVAGVGIGVPAVIDYERGETVLLPNIPGNWVNKPVTAPVHAALNCPTFLVNDARAFTLAEANIGAGRGYSVVAGVTLGTGIGGGIAIDGKLLLGLNGSAGEFGHICIDYNGPPDGSDTPGGLEGYGSGPAIAAMGVKAVMQGVNTKISELVDYDLNAITPQTVAQAADMGDAVAQRILHDAGKQIAAGIANVLTILNPHVLVVGGGVSQLGDRLIKPMEQALRVYNRTIDFDRFAILPAEVENAGAVGAALWARQRALK